MISREDLKELKNRMHGLCGHSKIHLSARQVNELTSTIDRLNRIMPHRASTCKHNKHYGDEFNPSICGLDEDAGICPRHGSLPCWYGEWELKE